MTVTRKWSLLAAVLVVAILVAGWFLLVSPKRSKAAELRADTATQEQANAMLQSKLVELKAQQENLPAQRARLAVIRKQIPGNPALPSLIRDLTAAGRKTGATVDTMAPAVPVAMAAPLTAPVAPVTTTDSESTGSTSTEESGSTADAATTPPAAPAAPTAQPALLYQVPLTLNVTGSYFELEQFINKLEGFKRSLLVTGFTVGEPSSADAAEGDLGLVLTGRVFMSPPVADAAATTPIQPTTAATATAGQ